MACFVLKLNKNTKIDDWLRRFVLFDPAIRRIVSGEFTGATGSELLNIVVVWFIVETIGYNGGYFIALTLVSAIVCGSLFGQFLSQFSNSNIAALLNSVRAISALGILVAIFHSWDPWLVVALAMIASGVRPHIDAAVIGVVSSLPLDQVKRSSANALVDGTYRTARIVGPAIAAIAIIHQSYLLAISAILFTLASVQFFAFGRIYSAFLDHSKQKKAAMEDENSESAIRLPFVLFLGSQAVNAGAWYGGIIFSLAIIINTDATLDAKVGHYGTALFAYGIGNVFGGLIGRYAITFTSDLVALGLGRLIASLGYVGLFFTSNIELVWIWTLIIALATPPCDLAFLRFAQRSYEPNSVSRIYRKKMISEYSGMLLAILIAPMIIGAFGAFQIIAICAALLGVCAIVILGIGSRGIS